MRKRENISFVWAHKPSLFFFFFLFLPHLLFFLWVCSVRLHQQIGRWRGNNKTAMRMAFFCYMDSSQPFVSCDSALPFYSFSTILHSNPFSDLTRSPLYSLLRSVFICPVWDIHQLSSPLPSLPPPHLPPPTPPSHKSHPCFICFHLQCLGNHDSVGSFVEFCWKEEMIMVQLVRHNGKRDDSVPGENCSKMMACLLWFLKRWFSAH